jgi:hypothetical protein
MGPVVPIGRTRKTGQITKVAHSPLEIDAGMHYLQRDKTNPFRTEFPSAGTSKPLGWPMAHTVMQVLITLLLVGPALIVRADDPPKAEPLPPPTPVEAEVALPVIELAPVLPYERIDRYEKWQYYAVDRQGYWRPRVAYSPYGAYYLYDGTPYRFAPIRYLNWMSYATD